MRDTSNDGHKESDTSNLGAICGSEQIKLKLG